MVESVIEKDDSVVVSEETQQQSAPFIGKWNALISTTNWEKGRLICQWRDALIDQGAPATEYSDEAWSQLVGGVTPQHVGRLRRTSARFNDDYGDYQGLFWSHFYAALDWDDAEMWLEGAVQSKWSISGMRQQRWETMGKVESDRPQDGDIVSIEMQEETQSLALSENKRNNDKEYIEGPVHEGPDFGDQDESGRSEKQDSVDDNPAQESEPEKPHQIKPFEAFTDLPDDVMEVAGQFKVAIIKHKLNDWQEIEKDQMLGLLDALKQLATIAPQ